MARIGEDGPRCLHHRAHLEQLEPRYLLSEYFLSPTGSDTAAGTLAAPWRTLAYALETVVAGDTLTLRGGTYAGNVWIRKPNLTLRSYPAENAIISTPNNNSTIFNTLRVDIDAHNTRLIGLEITGGYYYALKTESSWDTGVPDPHGPSGLLVQDCKLHDSGADVIKLTPGTNNGTITRCEIYNSGRVEPTNCEGIDAVQANNFVVSDNYIHDISTNGVYFKGGSVGTVLERNRVYRTGYSGILLGQDTDLQWFDTTVNPNYYESIDGVARNNIIFDTGGAGIGSWCALRPQIYNNTLYDTAETYFGGLLIQAQTHWIPKETYTPSTDVTMYNNIVRVISALPVLEIRDQGLTGFLNTSNNLYTMASGSAMVRDYTRSFYSSLADWKLLGFDANSFEAAPLLDTARDFAITESSPAVDCGKTSPLTADYLGRPRPSGLAYDIGAYEFQALMLPAPGNFIGAALGTNQVSLSWTNNSPTTPVEIEVATDSAFSLDVSRVQLPSGTSTYSWSGLLSNVPYHFRIRATDGQNVSAWVPTHVITAASPAIPNSPAAPAIVTVSASHVELAWTAPPVTQDNAATGYLLERSTSSDFSTGYNRLGFGAATLAYFDTNVQPQTTYHYRVIATNSAGWSAVSPSVIAFTTDPVNQPPTLATPAAALPAAVTDTTTTLTILGADDGGEPLLTYTWATVTRPAGTSDPTFSVNTSNAAKSTVARFAALGLYRLQCTIADAQGLTVASTVDVNVVGVNISIPQPPASFTATAQNSSQIRLQWTSVDPLTTNLVLERSTAANFGQTVVVTPLTPGTTSQTVSGLLANVDYYFRLRAANGIANSPWVTATVKTSYSSRVPDPPSSLRAMTVTAGRVYFTWSPPRDGSLTGYVVERATDSGFQNNLSVWTLGATASSYNDLKVGSGVTWYYRVRAVNSIGWSNAATLTVTV